MADEQGNRNAFLIQEHYCKAMDAPIYAVICAAIAKDLTRDTAIGARLLDWPGEPTRDALPLRIMGGLHALVIAGRDDELAAVFAGTTDDPTTIVTAIDGAFARHEAALLPWLDGPPQTNEPGRSAALMCGLMEVARRHGPKIELLEIGSSAGLNLLIGRYRFDLGGVAVGPAESPIAIRPDWTGPAPQAAPVDIVSARGCDVAPMDATDPAVEARLSAYVWAEKPERLARLRAAIAMVRDGGVRIDHADAADWIEARLAEPQAAGVTRVLMHSVVWQYLPHDVADRVRAAMLAAGAGATADRPIAWVMMDPDRAIAHQVIRVMSWPGHAEPVILGTAHAHAAWISYGMPDPTRDAIALPPSAQVWP